MNIHDIISKLHASIANYRSARTGASISSHVGAAQIAACLAELVLMDNRQIHPQEKQWFEASYQLAHSFDGTEWEDIYVLAIWKRF